MHFPCDRVIIGEKVKFMEEEFTVYTAVPQNAVEFAAKISRTLVIM